MSFQASSAVGLVTSAFRRSAGSLCTTPPGTRLRSRSHGSGPSGACSRNTGCWSPFSTCDAGSGRSRSSSVLCTVDRGSFLTLLRIYGSTGDDLRGNVNDCSRRRGPGPLLRRPHMIHDRGGYWSVMALNKKQRERLPSTLARSPKKAQNTYIETLESAEKQHGDGEAAHRIALASLKHSFEKVGDHWEPKRTKGPSDRQDAKTRKGRASREGPHRRWRGRLRQQDPPHGRGEAARHQGPFEDEEGPAREGDRQGQSIGDCEVRP